MADESYWDWYASMYPQQAPQNPQGPQAGPPQMTPQQVADFYRSVGITSPIGQPPTTRMVQSVPTVAAALNAGTAAPNVVAQALQNSASDRVRGKSGISTVAVYPTQKPAIPGPSGQFSSVKTAERLAPSLPGALPPMSPQVVAMLQGTQNPPTTMVAQAQQPAAKVAPIPFPPYRAVASQQSVMPPTPFAKPAALPAAANALAYAPMTQRPPLNVLVDGSNTLPFPASMRPAPQMMAPAQNPMALLQQMFKKPTVALHGGESLTTSKSGGPSEEFLAKHGLKPGDSW